MVMPTVCFRCTVSATELDTAGLPLIQYTALEESDTVTTSPFTGGKVYVALVPVYFWNPFTLQV